MNNITRHHIDALDFDGYEGKAQNSGSAFILVWVFVVGLLSAQRFWFPQTSALICTSLLLVPIIYGVRHEYSFATPIIYLTAINDLGGGSYEETPFYIKYVMYLGAFYFCFYLRQYNQNRRWIYLAGFTSIVLFNTMFHENQLDEYTFLRDVLTVIIVWIVVAAKPVETVRRVRFDLILAFSLGVIISELVNAGVSFKAEIGDYLSYSSSKYIVTFPLLYCLLNHYATWSIILFPVTFLIEIHYNSKMLVLSTFIILAAIFVRNLSNKTTKSVFIILLVVVFVFAAGELLINILQGNRILAALSDLFSTELNSINFDELDAVRDAEQKFFFSQNLYYIMFGNGLGTGMFDLSGLFNIAANDASAFSLNERNQSHYFRLHDSWSWFGFRFGLLSYLFVVLVYLKYSFSRCSDLALISSTIFLAIINSTFSINGLIVCGILALSNKTLLERKSQKVSE